MTGEGRTHTKGKKVGHCCVSQRLSIMIVVLHCDASDKGLGEALLPKGQPNAYASKALTWCELG